MKKLHWMILRLFPGPFISALGLFLFLLLMQFLMKYLPDIVGKDLPISVVIELVSYNLAYMLVLAVPMSVLIAVLMAFGKLAESRAYAVVKSTGVSFMQLAWPMCLIGLVFTGIMWQFNNEVLPEANYRARGLWDDILSKKPGFELKPGVFYNGLQGYSILAESIEGGSILHGVKVYDYSRGQQRQTILSAQIGELTTDPSTASLQLVLLNGEVHRYQQQPNDRYEQITFQRYNTTFDLSALVFERSDPNRGARSDRTMKSSTMLVFIDSLQSRLDGRKAALRERLSNVGRPAGRVDEAHSVLPVLTEPDSGPVFGDSTGRALLAGLNRSQVETVYRAAIDDARVVFNDIQGEVTSYDWERQRINRHWVEIHKKRSMAVACLLFILIGAPIGLGIQRGGLGVIGVTAGGIFLTYWVLIVYGEKFADRDYITPWIGIWMADFLAAGAAIWLIMRHMSGPPGKDLLQRVIGMGSGWIDLIRGRRSRKTIDG